MHKKKIKFSKQKLPKLWQIKPLLFYPNIYYKSELLYFTLCQYFYLQAKHHCFSLIYTNLKKEENMNQSTIAV